MEPRGEERGPSLIPTRRWKTCSRFELRATTVRVLYPTQTRKPGTVWLTGWTDSNPGCSTQLSWQLSSLPRPIEMQEEKKTRRCLDGEISQEESSLTLQGKPPSRAVPNSPFVEVAAGFFLYPLSSTTMGGRSDQVSELKMTWSTIPVGQRAPSPPLLSFPCLPGRGRCTQLGAFLF